MLAALFAFHVAFETDTKLPVENRIAATALTASANMGVPPEVIRGIFGWPECSQIGRLDWRTNPERYIFFNYAHYGVWVKWEKSTFPETGQSSGIVIIGGIMR
jgi:hypothetical protein